MKNSSQTDKEKFVCDYKMEPDKEEWRGFAKALKIIIGGIIAFFILIKFFGLLPYLVP